MFPEDYIPFDELFVWSKYHEEIMAVLTRKNKREFNSLVQAGKSILIYTDVTYIKEKIVNGRKPKNNVGGNSNGTGKSGGFQWLNVPLTDEDIVNLDGSEDDLERLTAAFCGLVSDGYGVSLKFDPKRASYSASIYKPNPDGGGGGMGLSAFSTDLWLALRAVLYKFDDKLGGEFPTDGGQFTSGQSGRRVG